MKGPVNMIVPPLGILQGRLTPSPDGSIQFFPKDNWENEFVLANKIGFDCMELLIKKESFLENPLLNTAGVGKINNLSFVHRMAVLSVHAFYDKSDDFGKSLERIIFASIFLGIRTILISFFGENSLKTGQDKELAVKQLSPALRSYCKAAGIYLAVETEMPAPELRDFVLSFGSPRIGVYYDIGNMASIGVNVADDISTLGRLIVGVHVKDRLADGGKTVPLGEGCVKFKEAFMSLKKVGYMGPFIIQGARITETNDVALNTVYHDFCRKLLTEVYGKGGIK